ncbi:hypothetical protein B7P43_G01954 [Cryptotermes secundus]|uniref:Reverse transcriptase domain-containing protein n=1 Tax=Cryptotermes secundus TaxID=105785 RepID=A0A2J7RNK7_9NEOP|nr:hypothetical protein B7P43_G01954 [Cryptotermes secundus]
MIGNRCFENVTQLRYLGITITNQTLIQVGIKRRLSSGNACYHSVQNVLSSRLLSESLCLSSGLFPSGFPTNILYAFVFSPIRATCPVHLIFLDLIVLIILGE